MSMTNQSDIFTTAAVAPETASGDNMKLDHTLCLIKPDGLAHEEEIINILLSEGFAILKSRRVHLTAEQTSQFYQDCYEMSWFPEAVAHLCSGPILAMVLSAPGALCQLKYILGPESWRERQKFPKSLRYKFGIPGSDSKNAIHGSANEVDAFREIHFFFPDFIVDPGMECNFASYYLNENVHPTLNQGLAELFRARPDDPVLWLSEWLMTNNPNKPRLAADICKK